MPKGGERGYANTLPLWETELILATDFGSNNK
jgi:hypothetical protein